MEVCVTNIEKDVTKKKMFEVFNINKIGFISKIRFVFKKNNKIAFISFNKIYESDNGTHFKEIIINQNDTAYVVYTEFSLWKCSKTY